MGAGKVARIPCHSPETPAYHRTWIIPQRRPLPQAVYPWERLTQSCTGYASGRMQEWMDGWQVASSQSGREVTLNIPPSGIPCGSVMATSHLLLHCRHLMPLSPGLGKHLSPQTLMQAEGSIGVGDEPRASPGG